MCPRLREGTAVGATPVGGQAGGSQEPRSREEASEWGDKGSEDTRALGG